ncbi:MAG TPA: glycosyltransferase family A protein [Paraburkholderia sp.]
MLPVSVIIPCYNAAPTLARTLDSCIAQPEAAQIIVVDDASTDATSDVIRDYARHDARIEPLSMHANGGAARARNWAALHAAQPLLAFIDADDEYLPGALAAASTFLTGHPRQASMRLDIDFVGFPAEIVAHPEFALHAAILSNTVPSSLVIRRQVYAALGGFPLDDFFRRHGGEDGPLALALHATFGNPRLADEKRVRMHYHTGVHAERYFRIAMGMQPLPEEMYAQALERTHRFAVRALADMVELRALDAAAGAAPPAAPVPNSESTESNAAHESAQ